jgi:hypothetical protein
MHPTISTESNLKKKVGQQQSSVNMEELIGNTRGFADSGYVVSHGW